MTHTPGPMATPFLDMLKTDHASGDYSRTPKQHYAWLVRQTAKAWCERRIAGYHEFRRQRDQLAAELDASGDSYAACN